MAYTNVKAISRRILVWPMLHVQSLQRYQAAMVEPKRLFTTRQDNAGIN